MEERNNYNVKIETGDHGYVLEDIPHLTDYIPNLKVLSLSFSSSSFNSFSFLLGFEWICFCLILAILITKTFIIHLQTYPNPMRFNPAYSVVKWVYLHHIMIHSSIYTFQYILIFNKQHVLRYFRQYFIDFDDTVPEKVSYKLYY